MIAAGELESAVSDALFRDADRADPRAATFRALSTAIAREFLAACEGRQIDPARARRLIDALQQTQLPDTVELRTSEGYAYYGLFPETYAASARRFANEVTPARVCAIGIRSIGTSLSAVVAAALEPICDVTSCTVRPRGHPFDRQVLLDASIRDVWRQENQLGAFFPVVDEGPGISGSSFASVVCALAEIGVPRGRIVLLPSWDPPADKLRSTTARRIWTDHRRYVATAIDAGITPERAFGAHDAGDDWSGGRWRQRLLSDEGRWPAVQPQHERWKAHIVNERRVIKFSGLGEYGIKTLERGARLSDLCGAAPPRGLRSGFIDFPFVDGEIARPPFTSDDAERVGRYIGDRAAEFGCDRATDAAALVEMIQTNVLELLGDDARLGEDTTERLQRSFANAPASDIDGRMFPREWIRTREGLVKVDAVDHGHDHFFPGPQNPSWDLAAAISELELDDAAGQRLADAYTRASGDTHASERLPAYQLAYAAFRGGYAALARDVLIGTSEAERFERVLARYRDRVRRLIPSVL
jgi:hypothetical protein